jgi:uncharacterized membrane protein YidH (DUF202 family)
MKKLFFLLSLMICITAYPAQDSAKYVTNSNVEKLADKYIDKISTSLAALAQGLKQPAEHVYKVLVRQQVVQSISFLVFPILAIICVCLIIKYGAKSKWQEFSSYKNNEADAWNKAATITLISSILLGVFILITCLLFNIIIQGFFNPEYGAIQSIISVFK